MISLLTCFKRVISLKHRIFMGSVVKRSAVLVVACASAAWAMPAFADQTDSRLDSLFEELRAGEALRAEENIARIVAIWSEAPSDTVTILYARANESARAGEYELASALLDHVIGLAPSFAQGYALRGRVRLAENNRGEAIEDFSKAIELEPRHFEVRLTLADILLAGNEKQDAYEMYQRVLEWNPHNEQARQRARALRRELDGQEI